jgi:hypothetical protein
MLKKTWVAGWSIGALLLAGCGGGGPPQTVTPVAPEITLSAASLSFASTTVGQTSATQVVTLNSNGGAAIVFSSITLSDTTNYSMMSTCGTTLAVSTSCTLTIAFKPAASGSLPATVTLVDNAGSVANSTQTIALSGTGTAATVPQATLAPSLTFPSTTAGSTATAQSVVLSNTGNATLTITGVALGGANPTAFAETSNCAGTLGAGSTCAIAVTFTPAAASTTYGATLTVTDNSGGVSGATQSVSLSGAGAAPVAVAQAVLTPPSLTFAATNVNSAAGAQAVTLSNPGNATLAGISISIGGGTASSAFSFTTTCTATLAAGNSCPIAVNFMPTVTGTFLATLSVADSATGSPQTVGLSGSGVAPVATLSATSINFPTTTVNSTTAPYSVTLTNTGGAPLSIGSIVLGGTNAGNFAETTTCGGGLAATASCTISATFTPAAPSSYGATITITDNAAGSPQSISLSGAGTTSAVSHTLYVFPEADNSVTPLYALVNNAQKTIDMTMYELQDTVFSGDLVTACARGIKVRVLLDASLVKSANTPAYTQLNAAGANCSAVFSNTAFQATHQKTITIDGTVTAIMSLNLQSQYYSTTRDFALVENDAADIAAIQATFNADYAAGTPNGGAQGASDFGYTPGAGDDLIWSPTTAQAAMLGIINNAKSTLLVENEEMGAANIVSALESACQRGVIVHVAMVNQSSYESNFKALEAAGCGVHVYPDTATGFYIHATAVVADYGQATQSVYMGSINYSIASMTENRELGLYISDAASVQLLYTTMTADYTGGTAY